MTKGGSDADVAALAAHIDNAPSASVRRMATRGIVQLLTDQRRNRAPLTFPLQALRRCLVGAPAEVVDEMTSAAARLVASMQVSAVPGGSSLLVVHAGLLPQQKV